MRRFRAGPTTALPRVLLAGATGLLLVAGLVVALISPSGAAVFAYLTDTEFVVAGADGVVARVPALPATGGNATTTTWTDDGEYAVVVAEGPGGPDDVDHRTLVAIDRDGDVSRRPCPSCTTVAPVDGSTVLAARTTVNSATLADSAPFAGFVRVDLSTSDAGTLVPTPLDRPEIGRLFLLAGHNGRAFATAEVGANGRESGWAIGPDGTATPAGRHESNQAPPGATQRGIATAAVRSDPTGTEYAVAAQYRSSRRPGCSAAAEIYLYAPGQEFSESTDLSAAIPAAHSWGVDSNTALQDLWWGDDGRLRAVLAVQPCGPADGNPTPTLSRWALNGTRWAPDGGDGLLAERPLGEGVRVVLRGVPDPGSGHGEIVVVGAGADRRIDAEVQSFSLSAPG